MKLKNEQIKMTYQDNVFTFDIDTNKHKKITSRRYPELLNKNPFTSVGKSLLDMFYQVESEAFDDWYTLRGAVAEHLLEQYFIRMFESNGKPIVTKHFSPQDFAPSLDQFPKNEFLGGVIDIAIAQPQDERAIIECKAKSIDKLKEIEETIPIEEKLQGELLCMLAKCIQFYMGYVFFTKEQEEKIKTLTNAIKTSGDTVSNAVYTKLPKILEKLKIGLNDVEIRHFKFFLDDKSAFERVKEVTERVLKFKETKTITATNFKIAEVRYLENIIKPMSRDEAITRYMEMNDNDVFKL